MVVLEIFVKKYRVNLQEEEEKEKEKERERDEERGEKVARGSGGLPREEDNFS